MVEDRSAAHQPVCRGHGDFQFIHVDPNKAAKTPFGGTIAHGFLTLSLIPKLMEDILVLPEGLKMALNYGLDSVRFIQPVRWTAGCA